ncbi:ATP-binding protein [Croceitalea sp. P059]|uniref:tetratricopeptide repeat-containing sensor histidine kinase n=1 Tax=Croceitalea sp. P059 TaxID=3075601 RepID=UPI0028874D17|nr:ATP-binding protein [Croceitalea sp. P059]MDT0539948.1 ATP-binding protein [Croceitalea sp. P059]
MRFGVVLLLNLIFFKGFGFQNTDPIDSTTIWLENVKTNHNLTAEQKDLYLERALRALSKSNPDSLDKISTTALKTRDSSLFRKYNKKVILLATELGENKVHAFAHWDLADFFKTKVPDSAFYHYQEAFGVFSSMELDSSNNYYPGQLLVQIGNLQDNIKDYVGAEISHTKAIQSLEKSSRKDKLYGAYNGLAISQGALNKFDKAIEYYKKAKEYIPYRKDKSGQERAYLSNENNIYAVYLKSHSYEKAYSMFENLLTKEKLLKKYPTLYARVLGSWAHSGLKGGALNIEDFETALIKSNKILDSINNEYIKARNQYFLGQVLAKKGDTLEAIQQIKIGQQIAEKTKNYDRLLKIYKELITLDKKNSAQYALSHIALNNELLQKERIIQDKFARIRMETDDILEENEELAKQKELYAGAALILLVLGLGIFTIISQQINNQKLKFKQKQQNSNQEIYNLMLSQHGKLEEGKKSEKKRISEELHDGILGQMLGIRLILSGLNERSDQDAIEQRAELIQKLQELEEEVRTISHELNASAYEKVHNFMVSIQDLINKTKDSTNIGIHLHYTKDYNWDSLNGEMKINIYRIIQECLQNCIKHSKCKNITVSFETSEKVLNLNIIDDGIGFDNTKAKKGIGLKNIISRVKKMKGLLKIDSKTSKYTKVLMTFPLDSNIKKNLKPFITGKAIEEVL